MNPIFTSILSALPLADIDDAAAGILLFIVLPLVQVIICWRTAATLKRIPAAHRFQEPSMVWLLLVPLFSLYWNFKVFPAVAESFQHYFFSRGIADVDDCGEQLARAYCILCLISLIPCVTLLTYPAALVMVILFLVKADELNKRIAMLEGRPAAA